MIHQFTARTMTELHEDMCDALVLSPREELDLITSVDVHLHNVVGWADNMDWEFDLKDYWLTKSRWSMMVRQYIDPEEFSGWRLKIMQHIGQSGRGVALMKTGAGVKSWGGARYGNKEARRWGSCMVALSFKARPWPQITLYSRTSYLGYLSPMDLTVAWMAARYVAQDLELEVKDFGFMWYNEAIQFHGFKSLAYLLCHRDAEQREHYRDLLLSRDQDLDELTPALKLCYRWMARTLDRDDQGLDYGMDVYNTYRRIRRRFHTEVMGYEYAQQFEGTYRSKRPNKKEEKYGKFMAAYPPLPSLPAETLDFSAIDIHFDNENEVDDD